MRDRVLYMGMFVLLLGGMIVIAGIAYGVWQREEISDQVQALQDEIKATRAQSEANNKALVELQWELGVKPKP